MSELVEFVELETKPAGKTQRMVLSYTHLSGKFQGQTWQIGNLAPNLSDDSKRVLTSASSGDVIQIAKQSEEKNGRTFWNLVDAKAEGVVTEQPNIMSTTTTANTKTTTSPSRGTDFNVGVKVGQARNQAVQVLCARLEAGLIKSVTREDIMDVAFDLICDIEHMEEMISRGENPSKLNALQNAANMQNDTEVTTDDDIPF